MNLQDISFLPDDVLQKIFYYLSSPYAGLLKNEINYITTNPFETSEYLLLKAKGDPIMRGRWSALTIRDWQFIKIRYNPYRLVGGVASPVGITENAFLQHLKTLKYLKLKTLRLLYPHIKVRRRKDFIMAVMKL